LFAEIVTPEAALWAGEATALIARSSDGDFTILPQHTPTVGDLVPGLVRVQTTEGEQSFVVHGGYFQVAADERPDTTRATVLAGIAEKISEIDVPRAIAAKQPPRPSWPHSRATTPTRARRDGSPRTRSLERNCG